MQVDAEVEVHLNIPLSRFGEPRAIANEVAAAVRELRPDLLHSHHLATDILSQPASKHVSSGSIIRHVHGVLQRSSFDPLAEKAVRYDWTVAEIASERAIEDSVCTTLCPSRELLDKLTRYGFSPEKLVHLPNAVDSSSYVAATNSAKQLARRAFGLHNDEYVVGFLGRLEPCKNAECLLHLAQAQTAMTIRPKYLMMGSGPLEEALRLKMDAAGIASSFSMHPASTHVHEFYAAIDVLVLPSRTEGHPFALLEAMASGVPVVASAIGGMVETIVHGDDGLLVNIDDLPAILSMIDLLADEGQRAGFAKRARRRAVAEFGLAQHQARLLKLYGQTLGARSHA